jgi:hypothetical protein
MSELSFNIDDFQNVISELVPAHHRAILTNALEAPLSESDFENIGLSLTGEKRNAGFIIATSPKVSSEKSMWLAIKNEVYDFLCTKSKTYAKERTEGGLTVKNLITIIATAIAATFHVAVGVITGAVTLALLSALKIGKNAWCKINQLQN